METTYIRTQISHVDKQGNVTVMYPQNTDKDVKLLSENPNVPANIKNLNQLVSALGNMAFEDKSKVVFYDPNEEQAGESTVEASIALMSLDVGNDKTDAVPNVNISFSFSAEEAPVVPEHGMVYWLIRYYPIDTNENDEVIVAYQEWIGIPGDLTTSNVKYYRNYKEGTWGAFQRA